MLPPVLPVVISRRSFHVHNAGAVKVARAVWGGKPAMITGGQPDARGVVCVLDMDTASANTNLRLLDSPLSGNPDAEVTCFAVHEDFLALAEPREGNVAIVRLSNIEDTVSMLSEQSSKKVAMAFSPDGRRLLVCAEDGACKVHVMEDLEKLVFDTSSLQEAASSCAWMNNDVLAISTVGGSVHVFNVSTGGRVDAVEGAKARDSQVAFSPDGGHLAVGMHDGVHLITVPPAFPGWDDAWGSRAVLPAEGGGHVTALAWSANSKYLAAATQARVLTVWSVRGGATSGVALTGPVPEVFEGEEPRLPVGPLAAAITGLAWTEDGAALVFADASGHAGAVKTASLPDVGAATWGRGGEGVEDTYAVADTQEGGASQEAAAAGLSVGAEPEEPSTVVAAPPHVQEPAKAALRVRASYLEGEADESRSVPSEDEEGGGAGRVVSLAAEKHKLGFMDDEEGGGVRRMDEDEDAEGRGGVDLEAVRSMVDRTVGNAMEMVATTAAAHIEETFGLVAPQRSFQPGATQYKDYSAGRGGAPKRYLVWNSVGTATMRQDAHALSTSIDVEFVESSKYPTKHYTDEDGCTMAALTMNGLVLASRYKPPAGESEAGQPAKVVYKPLGTSMASGSEWNRTLPVINARMPESKFPRRAVSSTAAKPTVEGEGKKAEEAFELDTQAAAESPLAVALGDGWLAVGTDHNNLRFLRTSGLEDAVIRVPGDVLSVAASGMLCAVVYHRSSPMGGVQQEEYMLFRVPDSSTYGHRAYAGAVASSQFPHMLATGPVPLSRGDSLQWLGFASNGMLCAHTHGGQLWALISSAGWYWVVGADTRAAAVAAAGLTGGAGKADSRVAYWPVGVEVVPVTEVESAADMASYVPHMPVLTAVFVRGGSLEPAVTSPRPITAYIPLRVPLLLDARLSAFDAGCMAAEMLRMQRMWCSSNGLSADRSGASMELDAANSAAVGILRGDDRDVVLDIHSELDKAANTAEKECTTLDKASLRSIKAACDDYLDSRAMQLLGRLHSSRALQLAHKLAKDRPAVAERAMQLFLVRSADERGELGGGEQQPTAASRLPPPRFDPAAEASAPRTFGLPPRAEAAGGGGFSVGPPPAAAARGNAGSAAAAAQAKQAPASNPFAKRPVSPGAGSKRRAVEGLDVLGMASPTRPGPGTGPKTNLNRGSSIAVASRDKRLREE